MPETVTHKDESGKSYKMNDLSDEFRVVADRIQGELASIASQALSPDVLAHVEVAEQAVDERALELQRGSNAREAWQSALGNYEKAWMKVIKCLGERKN